LAKVLVESLWPTITKLARKSRRRHIAVAYLGRGANRILPLSKGDSLLVDMSENTVRSGQTDPKEIEKYFKKGVDLFTCSNLHAKVYVFDDSLIVASANVSQNSKYNLIETGLFLRDKDVRARAVGWMKSAQTEPITPQYIKRCKRIYRSPHISYPQGNKAKGTPAHSGLWILSTVPTDYSVKEKQFCNAMEKKAKRKIKNKRKFEIDTIRWDASSRIAKCINENDWVVQIYKEEKIDVYPPSRVVLVSPYSSHNKKEKPRLFIHLEQPKYPHLLPWPHFRKKMAGAGLRRISCNSKREIRNPEIKHLILGLWAD